MASPTLKGRKISPTSALRDEVHRAQAETEHLRKELELELESKDKQCKSMQFLSTYECRPNVVYLFSYLSK